MTDNEQKAFRMVFQFCEKWRDTVMETDDQWLAFGKEAGGMSKQFSMEGNTLGFKLLTAALEWFNELYLGDKKPAKAGYFGRDDLST